jgi:hypothetical protein
MAADFYSSAQKVPTSVKERAKHHHAKPVFYKGERGVVIATYWRRWTNEIIYDVKCIPRGREIIIHPKVPEAELFDWVEARYQIPDCVRYKNDRGYVTNVSRSETGDILYRISMADMGNLNAPRVVHEGVRGDEIERYRSVR